MDIIPASKGVAVPVGAFGVVFTAPSGVLTVIESIIVTNVGAAIVNVIWNSLVGTGGTNIKIFPNNYSMAANSSAQESDKLILYPLDTIKAFADVANVQILISAKALGN